LPLFIDGDPAATADIIIDVDWESDDAVYRANMREVRDWIIDVTFDVDMGDVKDVDLMQLMPRKYHDSQVLDEYLDEVSVLVGDWLKTIQEMEALLHPDNVPIDYVQFLASLIGLTIIVSDTTTDEEKRAQLRQAIDWYKIKGSYESIELVAYLSGLTTLVHDYYTNDYAIFEKVVEFFAAKTPNENPPGFDSSYYKSPHFGLEVLLDRVYQLGSSDEFLFREEKITRMQEMIEVTRPVNTVPHYITLLIPLGYEDGVINQTTDSLAYAIVTDNWTFNKLYFDMGSLIPVVDNLGNQVIDNFGNRVVIQGESWEFDSGNFFDQNYDAFLNSIIHYKLGIGNKGDIPTNVGWTLDDVQLTGTVSEITIEADKTTWEIVVPASVVQLGLSELGLFLSDQSTMTIGVTFRDLDKIEGVELRIQVVIYKTRP